MGTYTLDTYLYVRLKFALLYVFDTRIQIGLTTSQMVFLKTLSVLGDSFALAGASCIECVEYCIFCAVMLTLG